MLTQTRQENVPDATAPLKILIVDDHVAVTKALARLIQKAGYEPVAFNGAAEALEWLETFKPAAAVLDIHLPDMNGLLLAQKMRQRLGNDMPIIVVSGDTSMETLNSLPHVGATYFFSKPLSSTTLIEQLRKLLGEQRAREAG
jgi:DNA-binding response OmpR family regulator